MSSACFEKLHLLVWFSAFGANMGVRCKYQNESKLVVLRLRRPQIGEVDDDAYFWTFDDVDFNGDDNHDGCHVVRGVPVPGTKQCLHRLADHTALFARDPVRRHCPVSCSMCYVLCACQKLPNVIAKGLCICIVYYVLCAVAPYAVCCGTMCFGCVLWVCIV